jgi:hypothetical protein
MQQLIIRVLRQYWRKVNKQTELLEKNLGQQIKQTELLEKISNQLKKEKKRSNHDRENLQKD